MALKINVKPTVKDFSFPNVFWRKVAIRIFAFALVSILMFTVCQSLIVDICDKWVDSKLTEITLEIAQMEDKKMPEYEMTANANVVLSKTHKQLKNNPFVIDASLSMYNMSKKELVSKSFSVPIVDSEELISWWKKEANSEHGYPTVNLNNEMIAFYHDHPDETVLIKKLYYLNFILFPTELVVVDKNEKVTDSYESAMPSLVTQYPGVKSAELQILGNETDDVLYKLMSDFYFESDNTLQDKTVTIVYDKLIDNDKVTMITKTFTIDDMDYQIDCVYQSNFWVGAWQYVALFEILGLLMCAGLAFINTKETLSAMYR